MNGFYKELGLSILSTIFNAKTVSRHVTNFLLLQKLWRFQISVFFRISKFSIFFGVN